MLKIRTVTTGVGLEGVDTAAVRAALEVNKGVRQALVDAGYIVQTTRITTNSFEEYLDCSSVDTLVAGLRELFSALDDSTLLNIGPVRSPAIMRYIPDIVKVNPRISVSAAVGCDDYTASLAAAEACCRIGTETSNGEGNFQYAVSFNCQPGIPFFPVGYHQGPSTFAIGCEAPGLFVSAMKQSKGDVKAAEQILRDEFSKALLPIQTICQSVAVTVKVPFAGIDASLAPMVDVPSLVEGFESMNIPYFGASGTLALCSMITRALKSLPNIQTVGYTGLMLPPLEDTGLAQRAREGRYGIGELLTYSAVCGVGLDTVPIPGDTPALALAALFLDVAALAFRLNKPLSARLFPCAGVGPGHLMTFDNPHLCDCPVFAIP